MEMDKIQVVSELDNKREEKKSISKEMLNRLMQSAPVKTKVIFMFYKIVLNLKNEFIFMNVLSLYDFICERNKELLNNSEVKLRSYLSNDFNVIHKNVDTFKKIYNSYANEVKRTNATKFSRQKINEKKNNIYRNDGETDIMNLDDKLRIASGPGRRQSTISIGIQPVNKRRGSYLIQNIDNIKSENLKVNSDHLKLGAFTV